MAAAPDWQHIAIYAVGIALIVVLLQRLPVIGGIVRFLFSFAILAFAVFLSGVAISPIFITSFGLIERRVPESMLTEGVTWGVVVTRNQSKATESGAAEPRLVEITPA